MLRLLIPLLVAGLACGNRNVSFDADLNPALRFVNNAMWNIRKIPFFQDISVKKILEIADAVSDTYFPPPPLPEVDEHRWWGEGSPEHQDMSVRPYRIQFRNERIHRLIEKLSDRENFTHPLYNAAFSYGMNSKFLDQVLNYWQRKYNFKYREARLNSYPQYMTNIQGLDIHFYHIRPKTLKKVVPLLMLHGWPLSNMEYLYLFPQLLSERDEYDYVFEIVAPSIPGFGFSEGTSKIGLNSYQIAIIFKNLMNRLGYKHFYIHGGDFGQYIAADMMTLYQDEVLGLHTNFPYSYRPKTLAKYLIGSIHPPSVVKHRYEERMYPLLKYAYYVLRNFGYFHMQATKPDTLGIALQDSPSGLASWILTAMSWSSNPNFDNYADGGLPETFNIDELLDALTIFWESESITTSIRLYAEITAFFQDPKSVAVLINPTKAPYSCIKFRYEIIYQPDHFIKDKYPNLVHSTTLDFGGHFAAFENPDTLADDIFEGVEKMIEFNHNKRYHDKTGVNLKVLGKDRRILPEEHHKGFHTGENAGNLFEENMKHVINNNYFGNDRRYKKEMSKENDRVEAMIVDTDNDDSNISDEYRILTKMNMHG